MALFNTLRELKNVRQVLNWHTLVRSARQLRFQTLEHPEAYRVLVLAAHPGDEVLGCGGVIAKHIRAGEKVHVLTMCDGSRGTKSAVRDRLLGVKRTREAKLAAQQLGVDPDYLTFWGYQDNRLSSTRTAIEALKVIFATVNPELIYLPHFLHPDPDSIRLNEIALSSSQELSPKITLSAYETVFPIPINRAVPIGEVWPKKEAALAEHKSQIAVTDWVAAARALAAYRGITTGLPPLAEGFLMVELELYRRLWEVVRYD